MTHDPLIALANEALAQKPSSDWYTHIEARQILDSIPFIGQVDELAKHLNLAFRKDGQHGHSSVTALAAAVKALAAENERLRKRADGLSADLKEIRAAQKEEFQRADRAEAAARELRDEYSKAWHWSIAQRGCVARHLDGCDCIFCRTAWLDAAQQQQEGEVSGG